MLSDMWVSAFRKKVVTFYGHKVEKVVQNFGGEKKTAIAHRGTPNGNTPPWKPQISLLNVLQNPDTSAPSH